MRRLRAIVLDMDGTLTLPGAIDFGRLRSRLACPPEHDVLTWCDMAATPAERASRSAMVVEEEMVGLRGTTLMPDVGALSAFASARPSLRWGLLTRNNAAAAAHNVAALRAAGLTFHAALSREWAGGPPKPHPAALQHLAASWGLHAAELAMVGDAADDISCARAAGATAILIGAGEEPGAREGAHHCVASLTELVALLGGLVAPDGGASEGASGARAPPAPGQLDT
jgi:phosphoglycolate phosphatase-like HAD superfamily hydrolase